MNRLSTSDICELAVRKERGERSDQIYEYINLSNAADAFCYEHFQRIRDLHKNSNNRGFSMTLPREIKWFNYDQIQSSTDGKEYEIVKGTEHRTITMRSFIMSGRIMITIANEKGDSVTMLGTEDDHRAIGNAGLHGINSMAAEAMELLDICKKRGITMINAMTPNDNVQIAI